MQADIEINGSAGFYRIDGTTPEGESWLWENVPNAEADSDGVVRAFSDDTRMTQNIADGVIDDGLAVFVNGFQYPD
jgi:hypothetical protein